MAPTVAVGGYQPAVKVIFCILVLISSALFGAGLMYDHEEAKIAELKRAQAQQQADSSEAARRRLEDAQNRSDGLIVGLQLYDQALQKQAQEHAREIKRLTTGRPCLNAGTVRLLNESGSAVKLAAVPTSIGEPAAADAAAQSDPDVGRGVATDTDVAGWIDNAKRQYDTCRTRLQALIDWWDKA